MTASLPHAPAGPVPPPTARPAPGPSTTAPPALVLVAHGSRDPRAVSTVRALMERVRALRPSLAVRLGHIELDEPPLPDTLARLGRSEAVLVPLLFGRGHHVKRDIPEMAAAAAARTRVAAPLGPHPLLAQALHARLTEAGWRPPADAAARRASAVVLAAAGSRDPESAAGTRRTARLLSDRLGVPVVPAYASAAAPTVPEAVRALAARGRHRVAVASCFTAPGRFATECAAAAPGPAAAPLGAHPAMARLVLHRYDQILTPAPAPARAALVPV
ncbi:sirohydrochlorin chelatase [Streptomyces sp. NPDC006743]|uniref:sirohydrochlorin chelatase n=1 Tax=Streptomyces sp. NPDC006743 TaxID=3154480 RepID=UPI0034558FBA